MIRNYIKIAIRNILRNKIYSFINISGLAIGIAVFILISLIVFNQLSYDQFHKKKQNIFRVNSITSEYGIVTASSWRMGDAFKSTFPEVLDYSRFCPWGTSLVKYDDKAFNELNIRLADPSFFSIFSFNFIHGDYRTALENKHNIVLTSSTANRYFSEANPIGKTLYVREYDADFIVSAVIEDIPDNSSLQFDFLARVDLMPKQRLESWEYTGYTFVLLKEDVDPEVFNQKIYSFYQDHVSKEATAHPVLQPFTDIHLYEHGKPGIIKYIYIFSLIAVSILIIACINFMNLSTARSAMRLREIGIRKVIGAQRKQLISQFLGESLLVSFVALVIALLLIELILPVLNDFANINISLFSSNLISSFLFLAIVTLGSGIISGSYPALYLSSFRPEKILKNNISLSSKKNSFRRILSVIQFSIAIGLIFCTLVIREQLGLIQSKDLGMNRENIVGLLNNPDLNKQFDSYKSELLASPLIRNVSASATNPFDVGQFISINWEGHYDQKELPLPYTMVDYDYFKTMEMDIIAGRGFDPVIPTDETQACVINRSALEAMGIENPIGKQVYFNHPAFEESFKYVKIIGVVEDFHHSTFQKEIRPFIFRMYRPWHTFSFIKITSSNATLALAEIESITKKFAPDYPFQYRFLDDIYNSLYMREHVMQNLFDGFAFLGIFISCLGLFGLAAFTAERKTKEIGIRKALGATVVSLISMLTKEFTRWVLIANLIAWPLSWYMMHKWLDNFVYRIEIEWWIFAASGAIALLVALLTVSSQAIKAAITNPVEALRYE